MRKFIWFLLCISIAMYSLPAIAEESEDVSKAITNLDGRLKKVEKKASDAPGGKWSGYMFGDYYLIASHHSDEYKNINGVWFRRIYLTYDYDISSDFSTRLRAEASTSDFTAASSTMNPFFKDAYLKWKYTGAHTAFFGLSSSPTWDNIESFWGYRSVEKTPLDLFKWGGSRDIGLAIQGYCDENKTFGYHLMLGSGSDTKQETNKTGKVYLALDIKPASDLYLQLYGDYENNKGTTPNTPWYTFQYFLGWKTEGGRIGLQHAVQFREQTGGGKLQLDILSAFTALKLADSVSAFGRFDYHMDPNPDASKIAYFDLSGSGNTNTNTAKNISLIVLGLDFSLAAGKVHLIPNVETLMFGENDKKQTPGAVVIPKLTVYYIF